MGQHRSLWFRSVLNEIDLALLRTLRTRGHWPPLERAVLRLSRLGEHSIIWLAASVLGVALHRGRRSVYARLARTVLAVEVTNALAKIVIGRPRPRIRDLPPLMTTRSQRSFPSAHASSSFAAARVLSEVFPAGPVYTLACIMALSRPYLGVHYPSDVLAGLLLGTLIADLGGGRARNRRHNRNCAVAVDVVSPHGKFSKLQPLSKRLS
jgi:membrane-associated phospholipid phosphatase